MQTDYTTQFKKIAFGLIRICWSTDLCEQSFSKFNFLTSKLRSQITDVNLDSLLKIGKISPKPDIHKLYTEIQVNCSHGLNLMRAILCAIFYSFTKDTKWFVPAVAARLNSSST
ncbi:hypothetical protein HZS_5543 [Henneguya salminicola]|nr:hypothetical protein HZS_5543 [Henneguya salminicola]